MYKMYLEINGDEEGFLLPVLPEKIQIDEGGDNKSYNIVNLGEVNIINLPKLTKISFDSYFPLNRGPYVSSEKLYAPSVYIKKIQEWRKKCCKVRFIFTGSTLDSVFNTSTEINNLFSIENFKYEEHGGEVGDIYYTLELKKYKNYAAKKIDIKKDVTAVTATVSQAATRESNPPQPKNYTVIEGDTLWHIAKRFLGDGNRYGEIATLNNISNPDIIYVGQVLNLP
ncbi:LysM peptidoglycan-binding domain-containing protein [Clostridium saccharoperbutylacetonicum]|uniref:LysM peptidoglycan-binding domain-containing protein n=1 Tax=Clostridium saccharoperbutylacetonicum TaxID=36745 RepID=UPI000983AC69|nr:LysM peptidoglycan-binding domain-containing protein [Clostridium saccharoperbutylacetonicum]AQR93516.1 LysM domain/BON superfamily protein [Clostridium saccharoperbutylacetonicum]NSB29214.1 nucleoid-associated protein YgaU [Clostridium saccharoperbutylacetonicum]